jgi:uncharacterized membrane protein YdjX (TVP38/TMEM64 family)
MFSKYFFKDFIKKKFLMKYQNFESKFKKNEFFFMIIYRLIGAIPFPIANILPVIFNVNIINYFFGSLLGLMPSVFVIAALGSGFESIINDYDTTPSIIDLISSSEIYIPIILFFLLIIIVFFLKKFFLKNSL